eukprot:scaffold344_cov132-Skeletonema_menzelii.AAC.12
MEIPLGAAMGVVQRRQGQVVSPASSLAGGENGRQEQQQEQQHYAVSPNNKSSRGRDVQESPPKESLRRQVLLSMIT